MKRGNLQKTRQTSNVLNSVLKRDYRYSISGVWLLSLSDLLPAPHRPQCSLGAILVPKLEKAPCLAH